ncbi:MAG: insulinase family protein [Fimbriimonadaceae bacterium]|nr:insulinase family protein [Fimbriimonadaceae bacterium]QYK58932.1 MAG: insulinase family protein [Fimbriimonadaceae bacterium]
MLSSLALVIAGAQVFESPKLRLNLDNGAIVHAEQMQAGGRFSLAVRFRAVPETTETHGWRHLLEHLAAKGPAKEVDRLVESHGMFLLAETGREWTLFTISGPSDGFATAVEAMEQVLADREYADDEVRAEVTVLAEELALVESAQRASWEAWETLFGAAGLSPFGSLEAVERADGAALRQLASRVFVGRGAVATVAGDIEPRVAAERMKRMLQRLPAGSPEPLAIRQSVPSGVAFASTVAMPMPPVRDPGFLATLGAAMGVSSVQPGLVIGTTPSAAPGLLTIGSKSGDPARQIRKAIEEGPDVLAELGLRSAKDWLARLVGSAEGRTYLRAILLPESPAFDPDRWKQDMDLGTARSDVARALASLRRTVEP